MKQFIILPANQTEGMWGYSAIGIETTSSNKINLQNMVSVFNSVREIDSTVSKITYDNPKLDIVIFNDEFDPDVDGIHVHEFTDEEFEMFTADGECKLNTPFVEIASYQIKIQFDAEYSDCEVYTDFIYDDFKTSTKYFW